MADSDPVALVDLEIISRFSMAVRTETVDRQELVSVLRGDLAWLEAVAPAGAAEPRPEVSAAQPTPLPARPTPLPARPTPLPARPTPGPARGRSAALPERLPPARKA